MHGIQVLFGFIILLMSVVIHEVSHGYAALMFGDKTALYARRLTLNPFRHIDPVGSVLVPLLLTLFGMTPFGWARPVPYNPANLTPRRLGELVVASAGVISNLLIALVFGLSIRFYFPHTTVNDPAIFIMSMIVLINIGLGIFNLIPIVPLDGSKILFSILPRSWDWLQRLGEKYIFIFAAIVIVVVYRFDFISPLMFKLYTLLTGLTLSL